MNWLGGTANLRMFKNSIIFFSFFFFSNAYSSDIFYFNCKTTNKISIENQELKNHPSENFSFRIEKGFIFFSPGGYFNNEKMQINMSKKYFKANSLYSTLWVNLHTNEFYFSMNGLQGIHSISAICIKQ